MDNQLMFDLFSLVIEAAETLDRDVSHLYRLHPSNQISPYLHPELFSAVRTSMEMRGDDLNSGPEIRLCSKV